ncbi:phage tail protein [Rhodobacteraceae bacterium WD3A24]|nr:phage tail protein [Rhodobacteraceae bacterium WD3A24]
MARIEELEAQIAALEASLGTTEAMVTSFDAELARMGRTLALTGREVNTLSRAIGGVLSRAFDDVVFDGRRLSDALGEVARRMIDSIHSIAMRPVQDAVGGAVAQGIQGVMSAVMPFERGAGFAQGRVLPFAEGGVVSGPVAFPLRGGRTGLMGEAGPEAIMPLARGPDGRLGVQSAGGGGRPVNVTINVATPDVEGFRRSQTQIAAQMNRLLAQGQRNR